MNRKRRARAMSMKLRRASPRTAMRGVALLTALLIVAIATAAAASLAASQQIDIRRSDNLLTGGQARMYLAATERWALERLAEDRKKNNHDSIEDIWAQDVPAFIIEGGRVSGAMIDLDGRFNLNNLVTAEGKPSAAHVTQFRRLLGTLRIEEGLTDAIVDWLDPDSEVTYPDGAEDGTYLASPRPYRSGNTRMVHPSELRLVSGVTDAIYRTLLPHVTALPATTRINVNTASAAVLRSLSESLNAAQAEALVATRTEDGPFRDSPDFVARWGLITANTEGLPEPQLYSAQSLYFLLRTEVILGRTRVRGDTLLHRPGTGSTGSAPTDDNNVHAPDVNPGNEPVEETASATKPAFGFKIPVAAPAAGTGIPKPQGPHTVARGWPPG